MFLGLHVFRVVVASQSVGLYCVVAIVTTVGLALYLGQWGTSGQ